jgi:Ca2+:H+ antiporter
MNLSAQIPLWTIVAPLFAMAILLAAVLGVASSGIFVVVITLALAASVFAAVHHAERVAHRIGEPYGTLVLALAVTLIEVALIVSLMIAGAEEASALAGDTVFVAVMIILNGIIGLCLLVGGIGRTIILHGVALLVIFVVYLVTTVVP